MQELTVPTETSGEPGPPPALVVLTQDQQDRLRQFLTHMHEDVFPAIARASEVFTDQFRTHVMPAGVEFAKNIAPWMPYLEERLRRRRVQIMLERKRTRRNMVMYAAPAGDWPWHRQVRRLIDRPGSTRQQ